MVSEVHDSRLVGSCAIFYVDGVVIGQCVDNLNIESAWETFGAVGVNESELQSVAVLLGIPHLLVIALETAM